MGNVGSFVLNLFNAEGDPANEPSCTVDFLRLDGTNILHAPGVQFPPQHSFSVPAFPQERNLHCSITPSLYRIDQTGFVTLTDGAITTVSTTVIRDPNRLVATYTVAHICLTLANVGPFPRVSRSRSNLRVLKSHSVGQQKKAHGFNRGKNYEEESKIRSAGCPTQASVAWAGSFDGDRRNHAQAVCGLNGGFHVDLTGKVTPQTYLGRARIIERIG